STRSTYATGQKSYARFCYLNNILNPDGSILPASRNAILAWVSSLAGSVQPATIKSYITHVRSLHVDADLPFDACESPVVQRVIRGIKKYHGERNRKPKQPITLPILQALLPHLPTENLDLYAACCVAFAGFLRCGE
ncbi:hypothetical protein SCHPADRAFT_793030, partial [Schizopora paradoxa]